MKGIIHALVALGLIFVVWILILSFAFNLTSITQRQLAESKTLTDAEEAENIVRSIENSFKLSFIQGTYDSLNTGDYWASYDKDLLTDSAIQNIKSGSAIKSSFESYANAFLQKYPEYVQSTKPENTFLISSLKDSKIDTAVSVDANRVSATAKPVKISSKYRNVEIRTAIDFEYSIEAHIIRLIDVAKQFTSSKSFNSAVDSSIPSKTSYSQTYCADESEPSSGDVYQSGTGKSIDQTMNEIGQSIKSNLESLQDEYTTENQQIFSIENLQINSGAKGITTRIDADCDVSESGTCCKLQYMKDANGNQVYDALGQPAWDCVPRGLEYTKTCTYTSYAKADSRIRVKEWSGNKYALWDMHDGKMVFDTMGISFNAVGGNS